MPDRFGKALKIAIGLALGFGIGFACRLFLLPSPAPTALAGALLVVAMTCGWKLTDRWMCNRPAAQAHLHKDLPR